MRADLRNQSTRCRFNQTTEKVSFCRTRNLSTAEPKPLIRGTFHNIDDTNLSLTSLRRQTPYYSYSDRDSSIMHTLGSVSLVSVSTIFNCT